jgi:phosphatidate cytidylyltransferase
MTRALSGAVLVLLAVAVVWFASPVIFFLVAEAILVLGVIEYGGLARSGHAVVPSWLTGLAAAGTCAALSWGPAGSAHVAAVLLVTVIAVGIATLWCWRGSPDVLASASVGVFPAVYLGLPIGALVSIRARSGAEGLFLLMLTVMISDTAQYYTGRAFGRRLLAPSISPKKTIEGALGGFVCGTAAFAIIGMWWLARPSFGPAVRVALGIVLVAAGIAGDLFESMLKRSAGVKDSSSLIPGHGGVLDRIDALLFAAPVYLLALTYL